MSQSNVNLKKLNEQSYELYSLIHATNGILNDPTPISELRVDFQEKVSDLKPQVLQAAKMAVATRRTPKEMMAGLAFAAGAVTVGWLGAAGIDAIRNGVAKHQAKKALMGYYEQLAVKQGMIIDEYQRVTQEMAHTIEHLTENEAEYREKIQLLNKRQTELAELLQRFNNLKQHVEK